jgi:hypothetical protein
VPTPKYLFSSSIEKKLDFYHEIADTNFNEERKGSMQNPSLTDPTAATSCRPTGLTGNLCEKSAQGRETA